MNRMSAMLTLMIPAAPSPWISRAKVSTANVGASAQAREAAVKTASPHQ